MSLLASIRHTPTTSRPPSPTRSNSFPGRSPSIDANDPLQEIFGVSPHSTALPPTQSLNSAYDISTPPEMWPSSTTPVHGDTVEIILDSDHLVMRGQGGDMNPAYLSGHLELNLPESMNIKEITMQLTGKAKMAILDVNAGKSNHFTHLLLHHHWSFLQGDKRHTHTLKAGHHSFPFSFTLDGNVPSSIQTYSDDGHIIYKLRASVVRSGFAHNYHAAKTFTIQRTFTSDALEFNQTLEIENTWPGKVMYALTIPFKAYAAGDDIPVLVKFMPLAKGVRVTQVVSELQETTTIQTKHSHRTSQRTVMKSRHELRNGRAVPAGGDKPRPPLHHSESYGSDWVPSHPGSAYPSRPASPVGGQRAGEANGSGENVAGPSEPTDLDPDNNRTDEEIAQNLTHGDDEVSTFLYLPIPPWTTPSHSLNPIVVSHKIKWSCSISNADGHVSELRCALPVIILDHSLLQEARSAGSTTRNLLFGRPEADSAAQIDLPSYTNHVYDRIAVAEGGGTGGGAVHSRSSLANSGVSSLSITPPVSRDPSRPSSPTGHRQAGDAEENPPRRELSPWVDEELLYSLGALRTSNEPSPNDTPAASRRGSRPHSRRGSQSGPAPGIGFGRVSRPASPERRPSSTSTSSVDMGSHSQGHSRPSSSHGGIGHGIRLHLSGLKSHKNKPVFRNSSGTALNSMSSDAGDDMRRTASSTSNLQMSSAYGHTNGHQSHVAHGTHGHHSGGRTPPHVSFDRQSDTPPSRRSSRFHLFGSGDDDVHAQPSATSSRRNSAAPINSILSSSNPTSSPLSNDQGLPGTGEDQPVSSSPETMPTGTTHSPGHHHHHHHHHHHRADPLNQVPSYAVASRGFLGGGVVPLDIGLPTYDVSEEMSRSNSRRGSVSGEQPVLTHVIPPTPDVLAQVQGHHFNLGSAVED